MANYYCTYRTNYFHVTDEKAYEQISEKLRKGSEQFIDFGVAPDDKGNTVHGFGGEGWLGYYDEDSDESDPEYWMNEMQKILAEDDALILLEVGNEKLRYVVGSAAVVTKNKISWINLDSEAIRVAEKDLGVKEFNTILSY